MDAGCVEASTLRLQMQGMLGSTAHVSVACEVRAAFSHACVVHLWNPSDNGLRLLTNFDRSPTRHGNTDSENAGHHLAVVLESDL